LTVQLEKARFELDGVDPKSVDMRNHKPVEANTAVESTLSETKTNSFFLLTFILFFVLLLQEVRKNVIEAEIAALRVQIDAAATPVRYSLFCCFCL
jgi:hypothetical protein